jgi:ketosteroid isomerase-like protein
MAMHGDAESVQAANQRFYEAVSQQNLLGMEAVWSHAPHVRCVHMGAAMLEGWDTIRDSWRGIFTRAIVLKVTPQDPKITVLGPTAIVTCREQINSFTLDGANVRAAQATNVFEKRDGRWQLIHYHASPIADTPLT